MIASVQELPGTAAKGVRSRYNMQCVGLQTPFLLMQWPAQSRPPETGP